MASCGSSFAACLPPKGLHDQGAEQAVASRLVAAMPVPGRTGAGATAVARCGAFVASVSASTHHAPALSVAVLGGVSNLRYVLSHHATELAADASAAEVVASMYKSMQLRQWLPLLRGRFAILVLDGEEGKAAVARGQNGSPPVKYGRDADGNATLLAGDGVAALTDQEAFGRALQPLRFLYGNGHLDIVRTYRLDDAVEAEAPISARNAADAALEGLQPAGAKRWAPATPRQPVDTGAMRSWRSPSAAARAAVEDSTSSARTPRSSWSSASSSSSSSSSSGWRSGTDATPVAFKRYAERRCRNADAPSRWSKAIEIKAPPASPETAVTKPSVAEEVTKPAMAEVVPTSALLASSPPARAPEVFQASALLAPSATTPTLQPEAVFQPSALLETTKVPEVSSRPALLEEPARRAVSPATERRIGETVSNLFDTFVVPEVEATARSGIDGGSRPLMQVPEFEVRRSVEIARRSLEETTRRSMDSMNKSRTSRCRAFMGSVMQRLSLDGRMRSASRS